MTLTETNGSVDVHTADILDLDALVNEAKGVPFRFKFGGDVYDLGSHMDVRAATLMTKGDIDAAMRILMGNEQWQRMMDSPQLLTAEAFVAIFNGFAAHSGVDLPNSSDSASSSPSTAEPSKQTSNGTTPPR